MFLLIASIACFCFSLLLLILVVHFWCLLWFFAFDVCFSCSFVHIGHLILLFALVVHFFIFVCFHFSFLLFVFPTCFVHLNNIQFVVELITTRSQRWMISKCVTNIKYIFNMFIYASLLLVNYYSILVLHLFNLIFPPFCFLKVWEELQALSSSFFKFFSKSSFFKICFYFFSFLCFLNLCHLFVCLFFFCCLSFVC
jgi:hypothetical protein